MENLNRFTYEIFEQTYFLPNGSCLLQNGSTLTRSWIRSWIVNQSSFHLYFTQHQGVTVMVVYSRCPDGLFKLDVLSSRWRGASHDDRCPRSNRD